MLPHQFSAFAEGLFGPLHSEFERTPKAASVTTDAGRPPARRRQRVATPSRSTGRTCSTEAFFVAYQLAWAVLFAANGLVLCAIGAAYMAACVVYLAFFYGDHAGKVCSSSTGGS